MGKISEIMLLKQPKQSALAVEVQTDLKGMSDTVYNDTRKKIVSCLHRGTYKELAALYNEMMEWIKNNGYKPSGTSIEYYYSNPNVPEEEQVTRIEMPLL